MSLQDDLAAAEAEVASSTGALRHFMPLSRFSQEVLLRAINRLEARIEVIQSELHKRGLYQ